MALNIVLSNAEYKVVGTRPIRHDGTDKVTGRAKYGADFDAAGLLHGKVLHSPHAHARIKVHRCKQSLGISRRQGGDYQLGPARGPDGEPQSLCAVRQ